MEQLQIEQQEKEHNLMKENLIALQDLLEKNQEEEIETQSKLSPSANDYMVSKFKEGIDQMIQEKEKEIQESKGKCLSVN